MLLEAESAGRVKRANCLLLVGLRCGVGCGGSRLTRACRLRYLSVRSCARWSDAPPPSLAGCWLFTVNGLAKEGDVRVTTAFKRMLGLEGASVSDVGFDEKGVVVTLTLRRRRRRVCSVCGQSGRHLAIVDYRVKRWRHLDLGVNRCLLECELRRLRCPDCGVRYEAVRWARAGSPYTRDFEDVAAFLAQQMAKTPIARLLRIAWDSVGDIVARVVADHLGEARFHGLVMIGVDEISCAPRGAISPGGMRGPPPAAVTAG